MFPWEQTKSWKKELYKNKNESTIKVIKLKYPKIISKVSNSLVVRKYLSMLEVKGSSLARNGLIFLLVITTLGLK